LKDKVTTISNIVNENPESEKSSSSECPVEQEEAEIKVVPIEIEITEASEKSIKKIDDEIDDRDKKVLKSIE